MTTQAQPATRPGETFVAAVRHAASVHEQQVRKGTSVPYLAHPLAVAALVLEDGGSEDEAVAGLLHDCAEDGARGVVEELSRVTTLFGPKVAAMVEACTDTADPAGHTKASWEERKRHTIDHLADLSAGARRVATADKLHNARSILTDLDDQGVAVWKRFNAGRDRQLWYYRALADQLLALQAGNRLARELDRTVTAIEGHPAAQVTR